jgi:NAD(P)-dependent dehydrogenase (short-subunit alcohol dehydrogenase family)
MMDLRGKTTVVTGAGSGVGRALALEFARAGMKVACCGRRENKLEETVRTILREGGEGFAITADVTEWPQVMSMVERVLSRYGTIDVLFNNAGSFRFVGPVWSADPQAWWSDVKVNLLGSMMTCRAVLPGMMERDSGVIVNMDGGGGSNGPNVGGSAYGCSKAALLRFTEGLAKELEQEGSSVLAFCMMPGFVHTEMTEYLIATPEREKWQGHVRKLMGSDTELPPEACANATMKLLAIASPELNGRIFYVDFDFARIGKNKKRIKDENLYVMHLMTLDGKLGPWPLIPAPHAGRPDGSHVSGPRSRPEKP